MALTELPRHLDETRSTAPPMHATSASTPMRSAAWLVKELERAGVARSEDGTLVVT